MPSVRADAASGAKRYGELANIDLRSQRRSLPRRRLHTGPTLSTEALLASAGATSDSAAPSESARRYRGSGWRVVSTFKRLQVLLRTVKCWDETPPRIGRRQNHVGRHRARVRRGIVKIAPFVVMTIFDDDEVKDYNPPNVLASFDLAADNTIV
jgi:hypothetical protein